jgi:hypothetical protein
MLLMLVVYGFGQLSLDRAEASGVKSVGKDNGGSAVAPGTNAVWNCATQLDHAGRLSILGARRGGFLRSGLPRPDPLREKVLSDFHMFLAEHGEL